MNILNEQIQHIAFGEGKVISYENGRISIQFSEQYGIKQFIYPDAFEEYLKMCNPDFQLSVLENLHDKRARIEAERLRIQQEQEEADRIMALERSKLIAEKKRSVPKSKTSKRKSKVDAVISEKAEDSPK